MARGSRTRRHLLVPAGVVATLALLLGYLGGFHTASGPLLGAYFLCLLVAGVDEDVMHRPKYRLAWGGGFLAASVVLATKGYVGVLTAALPFVGVALLSNLAYERFAAP